MDMPPYLHRLFAYDAWANREVIESLKKTGAAPPRALRLLAHIVIGEQLWMSRLKQEKKTVAVWPELTLSQCEAQVAELRTLWQDYLNGLAPSQVSDPIPYTNTEGESWVNTIEDILMHVAMHSAYHRAQIAAELRASGHKPANTDLIHCIRRGFVK